MLADCVDLTDVRKDSAEVRRLKPINLNVEVFRFNTQQLVAYRSTDEHCPPTGFAHSLTKSYDFSVHLSKNNPLATDGKERSDSRLGPELVADDPVDFCNRNALLEHRVAITDGDLIVLKRLMVYR